MGSRDRPHKEVKKKPKDKGRPSRSWRRFRRLPRTSSSSRRNASPVGTRSPTRADAVGRAGTGSRSVGSAEAARSEGPMAITGEDLGPHRGHRERQRRQGARGAGSRGRRRDPRDREAVRPRVDHEARLGGSAGGRLDPDRARSRWTWRSASAASRAAGSRRSSAPSPRARPRVCQHVIAEAQRRGGVAAFIDVEHALDPGYARACGVERRRAARQPARHRRAGPRDHRDPDPLRRRRLRRRRLRRGPRAARRDRGRDGRQLRRHPGPAHEPGAAQAHRRRRRGPTRRSSSPTSCARRSASCSATRRPRRAVARSSSTPRSASTSGASRRSRPARSRSATGSGSRS